MDTAEVVNTPYENAQEFLSLCNQALVDNAVLDSDGNQAFLSATAGSPAWLFALAFGEFYTRYQGRLRDAYNSNDPANCSDAKVLSLATIALVERNTGKISSVALKLTAKTSGTLSIAKGDVFTSNSVSWLATENVSVTAGNSVVTSLVSATVGAFPVAAGTVFTPATNHDNLYSAVAAGASIQGYGYEPIASLRQRIIDGASTSSALDACQSYVAQLSGVQFAKVYFNRALAENMLLPGSFEPLAPRTGKLVIFGTDTEDLIGETVCKYTDVPFSAARSHVDVTITATGGDVVITGGDLFSTPDTQRWRASRTMTIASGTSAVVRFFSENVGSFTLAVGVAFSLVSGGQSSGSNYTHMTSALSSSASTYKGNTSNYVTYSGQVMPIPYELASFRTVQAKVVVDKNTTITGYEAYIKQALQSANGTKAPGENFTSTYISALVSDFAYAVIRGVYLFDDVTQTWGVVSNIAWNEIAQFTEDSVVIEEEE